MAGKHGATAAAIRTAYGHRLLPADYRDLLNLHSVPEVVAYLKETPAYRDLLAGLEPAYTHRGYLEMLLTRNIFTQCMHFCGLEHLQNTPFFRFFIYEYEIRELLKKIQLMPQGPQAYISAMDAWLAPYCSFSLDALARAENGQMLRAVTAQTPYAEVLKKHLGRDGIPADFTAFETALRACVLTRILDEAKRTLRGADLEALTTLIGEQADLINLINAYRLKSVFHADEQTVRRLMLPIAGRLPRRICDQLWAAPDIPAFLSVLKGTRYGRLLGGLQALPEQS